MLLDLANAYIALLEPVLFFVFPFLKGMDDRSTIFVLLAIATSFHILGVVFGNIAEKISRKKRKIRRF